MVGNAAIDAARKLKSMLVGRGGAQAGGATGRRRMRGEVFRVGKGEQSSLPFTDVVKAALVDVGR